MKEKRRRSDIRANAVSCQGKTAFVTFGEAERNRKHLRYDIGIREPMTTYRCEACHAYHIGRIAEQQQRKRRMFRRWKRCLMMEAQDSERGTGGRAKSTTRFRRYVGRKEQEVGREYRAIRRINRLEVAPGC